MIAIATVANAAETAKSSTNATEKANTTNSNKKDKVAQTTSIAQPLGLEISGGTSFNAYVHNQDHNVQNGGKNRAHFGADDSRINVEVKGKAGEDLNGLEYSFLIGLSGDTGLGQTVEENRVKFKGDWGTLLAGVFRGPEYSMAVGAFNLIGGTGGILGNYKSVINETNGAVIREDLVGQGKDNTKIAYYTPRFWGVQFGYSYTPDGEHTGENKLASHLAASSKLKPTSQNIHGFGLNFKKVFANGFGLDLSATALLGEPKTLSPTAAGIPLGAQNIERRNVRAYALGFVARYNDFSIGGEYLDNGRSLEVSTAPAVDAAGAFNPAGNNFTMTGNNAGKVFTIGAGYEVGRFSFSLAHLYSRRDLGKLMNGNAVAFDFGKTKANVTSITVDYKLAPGLKVYADATMFDLNGIDNAANRNAWHTAQGTGIGATDQVGSNRGHALIFGTAISF